MILKRNIFSKHCATASRRYRREFLELGGEKGGGMDRRRRLRRGSDSKTVSLRPRPYGVGRTGSLPSTMAPQPVGRGGRGLFFTFTVGKRPPGGPHGHQEACLRAASRRQSLGLDEIEIWASSPEREGEERRPPNAAAGGGEHSVGFGSVRPARRFGGRRFFSRRRRDRCVSRF